MADLLNNFFIFNGPIIRFGYGLIFFILGLAIALQSRSSSRLELARSLAWLAAFGLAHSFYEWGELFSPLQESYLSPRGAEILHNLHLILLGLSFIFLFEFGVALMRPLTRSRWLHNVTLLLLAGYIASLMFLLPRFFPDPHDWHNAANALARYMIGFPGALLAAYGLRAQAYRYIAPLNAPHIVATLRVAGIALALYAVFGGLIPPSAPFFPANFLNEESFQQVLGIPPLVFQALIGLVLAATIIRALEIFDMETERRIEQIEQQQILAVERDRIARELHDGAIQTVYTASLLVDSARKISEPESPITGRLDRAVSVLNDALQDLRRNLGELRAVPSGVDLSTALGRFAEDPRFRSLVDIAVELDLPETEPLTLLQTDHVLAIVQEALSNVVRHAHARHVRLAAQQIDGYLLVSIQDDGVGLPDNANPGFGLRNMQDRARLLGGSLQIHNANGRGTQVSLTVPLQGEI